jgi:transcriptional regulator with XRE-family HTH domain
MTEHDRRATGQRIRDARIRMGWTQADLAATVGHPQPVLSRWENGARPITVDDLMLIARSLDPTTLVRRHDRSDLHRNVNHHRQRLIDIISHRLSSSNRTRMATPHRHTTASP